MASVLLGVTDRFYTYSFTAGGPGQFLRIPIDIVLAPDDVIYAVNRGLRTPHWKCQ